MNVFNFKFLIENLYINTNENVLENMTFKKNFCWKITEAYQIFLSSGRVLCKRFKMFIILHTKVCHPEEPRSVNRMIAKASNCEVHPIFISIDLQTFHVNSLRKPLKYIPSSYPSIFKRSMLIVKAG